MLLVGCSGLEKERVDLIVHNATIYTVDEAFSQAQAMAIRNDTIVAVGAEREIRNRYQGAREVDARKQFIYPGFIDGHCHFWAYAEGFARIDLMGTPSWEACLKKLEDFAAQHEGEWILGRGWDQNDWSDTRFPTKASLDALVPDRPVLLYRVDGHAALANSKALELAGISETTKVEGGEVVLEGGTPTGLLIDRAIDLVSDLIPPADRTQMERVLGQAQSACFARGITSVVDAGLRHRQIQLLDSLQRDSVLRMRIYAMLSDHPENYEHYLERGPFSTSHLHVASFKLYADGALGSRGAALLEPYSDDPDNLGLILYPKAYFQEKAQLLYDHGFQMNVHCIGDSANRMILDVFGEVLGGVNDRRWRIEHAQVVHPDDLAKFRAYTVIPSVQPTHATSDMYWAEERLGDRIAYAYTFRSLLEQNRIMALGTDFPVEGIDPLRTFYAAVFRQDTALYPEGGFQADQALTREQTLRGMTLGNALAQFEEEYKGSLEPGKLADFVILDSDLMQVPQEKMLNTQVIATYVGGEQVYSATTNP
ncbi:MAG: amidohydrolase [Leptolyngbya sp. SIO3F4]|nr:amidohydrolase [Leptolyngbya sp. SIO3F4]